MTEPTSTAADKAAIRALYQQAMDGWNRGSGEVFGPHLQKMVILLDLMAHISKDAKKSTHFISNSLIRTSKGLVWLERLGVCDF